MAASTESQELWFRSHVKVALHEVMTDIEPDDDGDYAIRGESSRGYLRVETNGPWVVHVFIHAAHEVPVKAAILREINQINLAESMAKVILHDQGTVTVTIKVLADAVTADNLAGAIGRALSVADRIGPLIVAVHGGRTPAQVVDLLTADD